MSLHLLKGLSMSQREAQAGDGLDLMAWVITFEPFTFNSAELSFPSLEDKSSGK